MEHRLWVTVKMSACLTVGRYPHSFLVDCVAGTTIGAIIGALYILNPDLQELCQRVREFLNSDDFGDIGLSLFSREGNPSLFRKLTTFVKEKYIYSMSLLGLYFIKRESVEQALGLLVDDTNIEEMAVPFAADLATGEDRILKEGRLLQALLASVVIPGVIPCVEEEDQILVDGGGTSVVPVDAAVSPGADLVIGVSLRGPIGPCPPLKSGLNLNFRLDEIVKHRLSRIQLSRAHMVIEPKLRSLHWADFSKLDFCLQRGREAAREKSAEIRTKLGRRTSLRLRFKRAQN